MLPHNWRRISTPFLSILGSYWRQTSGTLAFVILTVAFANMSVVGAPYVFARILDEPATDSTITRIVTGFLIYAVLMGLSMTLQHVAQYVGTMSTGQLNFISETEFFGTLVRKTDRFFAERNPAEVQSALLHGTEAINSIVQIGLHVVFPGLIQLVLALVLIGAAIDGRVAAIVVLYGAAFVALTFLSNRAVRPYLEKAVTVSQENARFVGNAIAAMEALRCFDSASWMGQRFRQGADDVFRNWRAFCIKRIPYAILVGFALAFQFAITFALLVPQYRAGVVSAGDLVLFNALLLQLKSPFEMTGRAINECSRSFAHFVPFADMWQAPERGDIGANGRGAPAGARLEFQGVRFFYEEGRGVEDINFVAYRGRITFITGETGAGKSTLVKLILGSITPASGEILVDGIDLQTIERKSWYAAVGIVPQEVMLLNDTLAVNIALGRPLNDERLLWAASSAAILERVQAMPQGFDTMVGERGLKLSGGERQRVAIARALYGDPKILLLDEASSALDETTEGEMMEHVRRIANCVTVIAVTHRKNIIRNHDVVVDLSEGRRVDTR